ANQALTDPLTGAYNRRFMNEYLEALVSRAQRHPLVTSFLMIDADHFKPINDELGHDQGDRVLQQIVQIIGKRMRQGDKLFRCGGEEFVLVLEDTDAAGALVVAEDIRRNIETAAILPNRPVTVSIGVSQYQEGQTAETLVKAGDVALYQAKAGGRNRVARAEATPDAMPSGGVEKALPQ
ncbi:MAG: GGDEF domain-containing protein, partial [Thiobacillaceae bacterium]|nr:GGDEF domain-containing protein [Thiobacillaceae bacterium]